MWNAHCQLIAFAAICEIAPGALEKRQKPNLFSEGSLLLFGYPQNSAGIQELMST